MAQVHSASEGRCILFSRYFGSDSEGKNIVISVKVHFPLELSAKYPLRSNIVLRFRWRQKHETCILSIIFFENHMIPSLAFFAIYFWPSLAFHEIQILNWNSYFFCHKHLQYLQYTFKEYEAFKFHIFVCVEFCRQT